MIPEQTPKQAQVQRILRPYRGLPETPARWSRIDRRLAEEPYEKQVKEEEVVAAMLLATARRLLRGADAPTPQGGGASAYQFARSRPSLTGMMIRGWGKAVPASVQIYTFLHDRRHS